jgi:hypothetical protein
MRQRKYFVPGFGGDKISNVMIGDRAKIGLMRTIEALLGPNETKIGFFEFSSTSISVIIGNPLNEVEWSQKEKNRKATCRKSPQSQDDQSAARRRTRGGADINDSSRHERSRRWIREYQGDSQVHEFVLQLQ